MLEDSRALKRDSVVGSEYCIWPTLGIQAPLVVVVFLRVAYAMRDESASEGEGSCIDGFLRAVGGESVGGGQLIQVVGPRLHHCYALLKELGPVVRPA